MNKRTFSSIIMPITSFALAVFLSGVVMLLSGYNPITAFGVIFKGAFGSVNAISNTLIQSTPLIFTGLAFMIAKKATMINLGVEGQLYIGALCGALVGTLDIGIPPILHLLIVMVAGVLSGGLAGLFIGFLKVKFGSNEVITTMMTNFIFINFTSYLVTYPLKAEGATAQSERMLDSALLPKIFSSYQITYAIIIAIISAILIKVYMDSTKVGMEIKAVGLNLKASSTAGIKVGRIMLLAMFVSGAVAGLAGSVQVMSVNRRFVAGFSSGYGFSGIAVTALANDSAIGIILSGIIFGALKNGANYLNMTSRTPTEFVMVIQALVVIFVSAPLMIQGLMSLFKRKEVLV